MTLSTHTSLTYLYHVYMYGSLYATYTNFYTTALLLFIAYSLTYMFFQKSRVVQNTMVLASITLIFINYSYLTLYSIIKDVSLSIYPLLLMLTSNHAEASVISFDWGQLAITSLTYYVIRSHISRKVRLNT